MEKITLSINSEEIRLDHLLQLADIASSGGQAGQMIKDGLVKVNDVTISEKRKKIHLKDKIIFDDNYLILLKTLD